MDDFKMPEIAACAPFSDGEIDREQDGERIVLSVRDFARFLKILDDSAPPTPALIEAIRTYRQLKREFPQNNL